MQTETPKTYGEEVWAAARTAALYITRITLFVVLGVTIGTIIGLIVADESILRVRALLTAASGRPGVYGFAAALMLVGGLWGYAYRRPVLGVVVGAAFFITMLLSVVLAIE